MYLHLQFTEIKGLDDVWTIGLVSDETEPYFYPIRVWHVNLKYSWAKNENEGR